MPTLPTPPTKQPGETLPYPYSPVEDMSVGDALIPASTVITIVRKDSTPIGPNDLKLLSQITTVTPKPSGAIQPNPDLPGYTPIPLVNMYLEKGISGVSYKITIVTETDGGSIFEDDFTLKVRDC
jgi:hypothetical protein